MSIRQVSLRIGAAALAAVACLPALVLTAPGAVAGTVSNQVQLQPVNCTPSEWAAVFQQPESLITVSGTNQNGNYVTWQTTSHVDGVFLTRNWWWWGPVTVTLHPSGKAPITITGYVPPDHSDPAVQIFGGNTVLFTCWGSEGVTSHVIVPQTAYGFNPGCVSLENLSGAYYQEAVYTGRFFYDGHTYISGSGGGLSWTPASFMTVRNKVGQAFAVPRISQISYQIVCY